MRRMDDLIGEFITETSESLATLEQTLAGHARRPMGRDGWAMAYRLMHTIKGTCGFLQLPRMEAVASASQEMLASLRDGSMTPTDGELRALRAALAQIRYMMDYVGTHGREPAGDGPPPAGDVPSAEPHAASPMAPLEEKPATVIDADDPFLLPPVPPAAQPVVHSPQLDATPPQERVSHATLASLLHARNQLKHARQSDASVHGAQRVLDMLVEDLKEKLLPRTAPATAYPKVAKVLLVESHGMRFALPQSLIREVVRIGSSQRHEQLDEGAMISLRGAWLPRVSLAQQLRQPSSAQEAYALVLELQHERLVLCVEQVGTLEELMLQPVPSLLRASEIYEAASILGDGSPCLVLDCAALLSQRVRFPSTKAKQRAMQPPAPSPEAAPSVSVPAAPIVAAPPVPPAPVISVQPVPMLMFGDGTSTPKAIVLTAVGRVEQVPASDVTRDAEGYAVRCRGELLRPQVLPGSAMPVQGELHLITLIDAPHMALVAHRVNGILDVEIALPEMAPADQPILLRTAMNGAITEILNPRAYLPAVQSAEVAHG